MAITAAKQLKDFDKNFLPPEQAASIFDDAVKGSVAMQMFQRQELGPAGVSFPILTNKPTANWVAEAGKKPTTQADVGIVTMKPQKIAAIAVMSQEVVRANPANYSQTLRTHLADAFAVAFDLAVFHNKGGDGTGTGPFDHHVAETTKSVEVSGDGTKLYDELVQAITLNVKGTPKKKVTGWAFDTGFEPAFLDAKDNNGRPLFAEAHYEGLAPVIRYGSVLGRISRMHENVGNDKTVGFAGDWTKGAWGAVGGIEYDISTEATVTIGGQLVSLYENNLVALRAEAEFGFVLADKEAFVKLVTK